MEDPEAFFGTVKEKADAWGVEVLFPVTEKSLKAVLPRRADLPGLEIPFPDAEVFDRVSDKAEVARAAKEEGIPVPRQWEWRLCQDVEESPISDSAFPVVIKPTASVAALGPGHRQRGVRYAETRAVLDEWIRSASADDFPVLVQERIRGYGAGVFVLSWDRELVAAVGHRRIREKPPSGGVSAVRDSTVVDPDLLEKSLGLLYRLGWRDGVAMVEFKVEDQTGVPYLLEVNGRFWGSLQLAVDAGVDFPNLLIGASRGDRPANQVLGTPGVRTRWLLGDLDQILLRLLRGPARLNLPPGFPGRIRGILDFLWDFRPGVRLEVLRLSDLRPFLTETAEWFRAIG
jgi:predicted ATP-grasp superfamily ATP-dependent carboligase